MRVRLKCVVLLQRCLAILICISLFAELLAGNVNAEPNGAEALRGDFYIVYDNSASASKYDAEDIFADIVERLAVMVDFDAGSRVIVYPMLPVIITGLRSEASDEPIVIDSYDDIAYLHNIFTQDTGFTQFDSVEKAFNDLIELSGAEAKRLFIISDCDFTDPDNINRAIHQINEMLNYAADDPSLTIHCLINEFTEPKMGTSRFFLAEDGRGCEVFTYGNWVEAADYCIDVGANTFKHDKLISSEENELSVNISNPGDKLVVFADGSDTGGSELTTPSGETVDAVVNNFDERGSYGVYVGMDAGMYTVNCYGSEKVVIYIQYAAGSDAGPQATQTISPMDVPSDQNSTIESYVADNQDDKSKVGNGNSIQFVLALILLPLIGVLLIRNRRPKEKKYEIFISYRRGDAPGQLAGRIYDRLTALNYRVFLDMYCMKSGNYLQQLHDAINESEHFILILSPDSLEQRRDGEVYLGEIKQAIEEKKHIIPVMMSGFCFPASLQEDMKCLPVLQAVEASPTYFEDDMAKIIKYLNDRY